MCELYSKGKQRLSAENPVARGHGHPGIASSRSLKTGNAYWQAVDAMPSTVAWN